MNIHQPTLITPDIFPSRAITDYDHDASRKLVQLKKTTAKVGRSVFVHSPPQSTMA